jgi:hypothetical protein
MSGKQIAETIVQQLAGHWNRLSIMTGATNPAYSDKEHYFSFRFKMCKKANYCKIALTPLDTCNIEFGKIHGMNYKVVEDINGAYAEDLKPIFERFTGLYLSL